MVSAAVTVIAESGAAPEFESFVERWRAAKTPQEELRYLYALPRFHDDACFDRLLELSLSEVRTQNAPFLIGRALTNRTHGAVAWEFVRKHWPEQSHKSAGSRTTTSTQLSAPALVVAAIGGHATTIPIVRRSD
jgi:hypothetical protein